MICCLCGEQFEPGDIVHVGTLYRFRVDPYTHQKNFTATPMEDGSESKLTHAYCMVGQGYPLEVIGAGRQSDV
jgi:hypothetical protein